MSCRHKLDPQDERACIFCPPKSPRIEPSQARYRSAHAMQRLANALGVQLDPTVEDCVCLERLATQAERWRGLDECVVNPTTEEIEEDLDERVREEIADERSSDAYDANNYRE